ncbi:hypothetical protein MCNS_29590 [Mycobacterium conspicuum]|uniref:Uncharacterized protein n=1 Tax=Mycobacterium conspicuum TaxID=44010 RepID=A0A7I7YDV6_9MYCO|nr:hypothetical protein MCNS_29590 [Mycobacterium conspicuum]
MPIRRGADQCRPERRFVGQRAHHGTFGGAQPLELFVDIFAVELDILPARCGIGRDDLHRIVELFVEQRGQVRMPGDHRVHRVAQPVGVERAGHGDR